ncbi:MAG: hypothetical protein KDI30_13555 [Pseudomonadales bacterium]|nr:hypothetical protein [Pseudomonadales bacterium]
MSVTQYLEKYAEAIVASPLLNRVENNFHHVLVIPACCEETSLLGPVLGNTFPDNLLLILVINQHNQSTDKTRQKNQALLGYIQRHCQQLDFCPRENLYYFSVAKNLRSGKGNAVIVVDRFTKGWTLPEKQGVGLARKIGADIALCLIHKQKVLSSWIHSSDADTKLPDNYFFKETGREISARTSNFKHQFSEDPVGLSTLLYEISLRYYFYALRFCRSPYAYFSIGSTLAFHHEHYAAVRGFPKRNAGEDFYLLNKLAKTGNIIFQKNVTVHIESRFSDRVPFGTGPAAKNISLLEKPVDDYLYYHPGIFVFLERTLSNFPALFENNASWRELDTRIISILESMGFMKAIHHAKTHSRNAEGFVRHLHQWFDAFRTLKFIHLVRDSYLHSVNLSTMLRAGVNSGLFSEQILSGLNPDQLAFNDLKRINDHLGNIPQRTIPPRTP